MTLCERERYNHNITIISDSKKKKQKYICKFGMHETKQFRMSPIVTMLLCERQRYNHNRTIIYNSDKRMHLKIGDNYIQQPQIKKTWNKPDPRQLYTVATKYEFTFRIYIQNAGIIREQLYPIAKRRKIIRKTVPYVTNSDDAALPETKI